MLRKLIKYDLRSLSRFLVILHAFLLVSAFLVRFFLMSRIHADTSENEMQFLLITIILLCTMLLSGISIGTQLLVAVRFYRNLFTDEGYLTRTLPVTNRQHLISKTVAGTIWCAINLTLIYLSLYIIVWTPFISSVITENKQEILEELGLSGTYDMASFRNVMIVYFLFNLISCISTVVMIYASITIGQLFSGHRVLGAVAAYFVISTVISLFLMIIMTVFGSGAFTFYYVNNDGWTDVSFNIVDYLWMTIKISMGVEIISTIILAGVMYYIMEKKINLA